MYGLNVFFFFLVYMQFTAEKKPRLLFTTRDIASKRTKDGSWQSFIESRGEKKMKRVGEG